MAVARLRIAVIGAGPAGLAATKALHCDGHDVTCFEAADRVGGVWAYENSSGLSPAYRTLHLNTSRARTEFAALPLPGTADYPSHWEINAYLESFVDHFGFRDRIRFESPVTLAAPRTNGLWEVTARGECDVFDAVVVANGHNWEPRWPEPPYPGDFAGEQMHAHDFRDNDALEGRGVLVVGMGNSAMDIAVESSLVARRTYLSVRRGSRIVPKYLFGKPADQITRPAMTRLPWRLRQAFAHILLRLAVGDVTRYGLPAPSGGLLEDHPTISDTILHRITHGEVTPKGAIAALDGDGVRFADGSREEIDTIVWCTGYRVALPFLPEGVLDAPPDQVALYKRVFSLDHPGLFFVGLMQSTGSALPIVEVQSDLLADHLAGRWAPPARGAMARDCERALARARARFGDRRPAMRVDFDLFMRELASERRSGAKRADGRPPLEPRAAGTTPEPVAA